MANNCSNREKCGFYLNYKEHSEVIKNNWIEDFCNNAEKSESCEKKMLEESTGQPLPDHFTPTGKVLRINN
ncbi:MAG: hypothetical protein PQJ46_12710 [Spirochaetales bacterium]|nr:hypothetical protein [Spirochaetales bacterium]